MHAGRRVRAPQNLAAGLALVAISGFALWAGAGLEWGRLQAMGPGLLPRALAALVGLTGLALVALSLVKQGAALERWHWRGPLLVCAGILAFALTIRTVGLLVAAPAVALVSGAASPDVRVKELLVFSAILTAFSIGLFKYALGLPIPVLVLPGVVVL